MKRIILLCAAVVLLTSCEKILNKGNSLSGTQSPIGAVDNSFGITTIDGLSDQSAVITELNDGISTISYTCRVDDPLLLTLAPYIPGTVTNGNLVTGGGTVKITDQGIMNVYDEGNLVLVKYNANVGDKYTLKRGSGTIVREVTAKSTTDDYAWGWFMIKTITVEETGRGIPGVSKVIYQTNHKFGLVGIQAVFEDGTSKSVRVFSTNAN